MKAIEQCRVPHPLLTYDRYEYFDKAVERTFKTFGAPRDVLHILRYRFPLLIFPSMLASSVSVLSSEYFLALNGTSIFAFPPIKELRPQGVSALHSPLQFDLTSLFLFFASSESTHLSLPGSLYWHFLNFKCTLFWLRLPEFLAVVMKLAIPYVEVSLNKCRAEIRVLRFNQTLEVH